MYEFEAGCSNQTFKAEPSEEYFHGPPLIVRQRADLALRVFCRETAAALKFLLSSHGDRRIRCSRSELIH